MEKLWALVIAAVFLLCVGHAKGDIVNASGQALGNLPFEQMIGTPLSAVVYAQSVAALETTNFIQTVGFQSASSHRLGANVPVLEVTMVSFNYWNQQANGSKSYQSMQIPFLFMIPIPYLQIDLVTLDLNVLLSTVESFTNGVETGSYTDYSGEYDKQTGTSYGSYSSFGGRTTVNYGPTYFTGGYGSEVKSSESVHVQSSFSLSIHVQGSQAPIPEGMVRVLNLFETIVASGLPGL